MAQRLTTPRGPKGEKRPADAIGAAVKVKLQRDCARLDGTRPPER